MTHMLAKVHLRSGRIVKMRAESFSIATNSFSWVGLRKTGEWVLKVKYDEIEAITVQKKMF